MIDRVVYALQRRPVRLVEGLLIVAGALGWIIEPEAREAILTLVALVLAGGEAAQRHTTPTVDPKVPDGHKGEA